MQWNDIPSSRRKHFTPQSSLGQGLTPLEEQPMAPHLARRQQQPAEQPLIAGPELPGAAQPLLQSTYQALCQHSPAGGKQASWRGQHAVPPTRGIPPSSLMQYSSPFDRSAADQQSQVPCLSTPEVLLVSPSAAMHHWDCRLVCPKANAHPSCQATPATSTAVPLRWAPMEKLSTSVARCPQHCKQVQAC